MEIQLSQQKDNLRRQKLQQIELKRAQTNKKKANKYWTKFDSVYFEICQSSNFLKRQILQRECMQKHKSQKRSCLLNQLYKIQKINRKRLSNLLNRIESQSQISASQIQFEVQKINNFLMCRQRLIFLKDGLSNKSIESRNKIVSLLEEEGKISKQNLSLNSKTCQLCLSCNSIYFHKLIQCQACHSKSHDICCGQSTQETSKTFFCIRCLYNHSEVQITCEICCLKDQWGMLMIKGRYSHAACILIHFSIEPHYTEYKLNEQPNYQKFYHQMNCLYCDTLIGAKLCCSQCGNNTFHLICGYLNGCDLQIMRSKAGIQIDSKCTQCLKRSFKEQFVSAQVELRNQLCNFKQIVQGSINDQRLIKTDFQIS